MNKSIPQFDFVYSFIYDKQWHLALNKQFHDLKMQQSAAVFIKNLDEKFVIKEQKNALCLISENLNLCWKSSSIKVYFVNQLNIGGFSDPLTIKISDNYMMIIHTLIHEATHVILIDNSEKINSVFTKLKKLFPSTDYNTRLHLIVNAVTNKIFEQLYSKQELDKIILIEREFELLKESYSMFDKMPEMQDKILKLFIKS